MSRKSNEGPAYVNKSDEFVWGAFMGGDREAFASLYHRYFPCLVHYGYRFTADKELLKDCIHDLFVEIWNNKKNLSQPVSVKAYLFRSVQRKVTRSLKKNGYADNGVGELPDLADDNSKETQLIAEQLIVDQKNSMNKAMLALTKRQQEAVYLKFYANLSYSEIAAVMKIGADSIYNLISKSIDVLHIQLRAKRKY